VALRRRFGRAGKRSTGFIGATEVILDGRLTAGKLIAILRFTGASGADLPALSAPFLLVVVAETLLLLTFLVAPLVDFLVADFLAGFFLLAVAAVFFAVFFLLAVVAVFLVVFFLLAVATAFFAVFFLLFVVTVFFLEAAFGGDFLLARFAVVTFFVAVVAGFLADRLVDDFLVTFAFAALPFLLTAFVDVFFELLRAAFLLTDFFRAAMLSILALALSRVCAKRRIIHSHLPVGRANLTACRSAPDFPGFRV